MTRFIDDRGRLFGKVSIVDLVVLLVVVALAVVVGLRVSRGDPAAETVPVKITFHVRPVDASAVQSYTALGTLKDREGRVLGTIEQCEILEPEPGATGTEAIPQVALTVSGEGYLRGDTVHVGPLSARVGASVRLVGPGWEGNGLIIEVETGAAADE